MTDDDVLITIIIKGNRNTHIATNKLCFILSNNLLLYKIHSLFRFVRTWNKPLYFSNKLDRERYSIATVLLEQVSRLSEDECELYICLFSIDVITYSYFTNMT